MKKQYLIIPIVLMSLFTVLPYASAQLSEERSAAIEARRAEMDAKREAMREEAEAKRAQMQTRRIEFQQDIAKRKVENTVRVMTSTIERLRNIIERIESRIDKINDAGGDTTASEDYVEAAEADLVEAEEAIQDLLALTLDGEKAEENFEKIRTGAASVREHIRSAHTNLMMAVRSLPSVEAEDSEDEDSE